MKNEKILLFEDRGKRTEFIKKVTEVKDKANDLIQLFNQTQPWQRIETIQDFQKLYDDPLKMLDQCLLSNIDLKIAGNKTPNAGVLASLLAVDRPAYMKALGIDEPSDDDCPGCKKQTIKVTRIRINAEFYQYTDFLFFINGSWLLNQVAIDEHCDINFNVYAESPEALKLVKHWEDLVKIINEHNRLYPLGSTHELNVARAFKLQQLNGKFLVNNLQLSEQVRYMKVTN